MMSDRPDAVQGISPRAAELEAVWKALANPIRRTVLDVLREGPRTTGELADRFPDLSRFAVMQHLKVLEEAELLMVRREGRVRHNYLNPVPIRQIFDRWVSPYMQPWTEALVSLRSELETRSSDKRPVLPTKAASERPRP